MIYKLSEKALSFLRDHNLDPEQWVEETLKEALDPQWVAKTLADALARLKLTPEQSLAEELHALLCKANHVDDCDWAYGSWEKPSRAHRFYFDKALKVKDTGVPLKLFMKALRAAHQHQGV